MTYNDATWIIPVAGAILLLVLDLTIQSAYRAYAAQGESSPAKKSEIPDECMLRKMSKLVRFFSSPVVHFACPSELRVGRKFTAALTINLEDKLVRAFEYDHDSKLSVQPRVYAVLSGQGFRIKLDSDLNQLVDCKNLAWTWTAIPLRNGVQTLTVHLTFSIEGRTDNKTYSMWLGEKSINVSENKWSAMQLWCSTKWRSAIAIGLEVTMFYFLLKYVIELG